MSKYVPGSLNVVKPPSVAFSSKNATKLCLSDRAMCVVDKQYMNTVSPMRIFWLIVLLLRDELRLYRNNKQPIQFTMCADRAAYKSRYIAPVKTTVYIPARSN